MIIVWHSTPGWLGCAHSPPGPLQNKYGNMTIMLGCGRNNICVAQHALLAWLCAQHIAPKGHCRTQHEHTCSTCQALRCSCTSHPAGLAVRAARILPGPLQNKNGTRYDIFNIIWMWEKILCGTARPAALAARATHSAPSATAEHSMNTHSTCQRLRCSCTARPAALAVRAARNLPGPLQSKYDISTFV